MGSSAVPKLSSLLQRTSIDDHEEVIKACDAVLKRSQNNAEAQHLKIVALLKLDRFEDVIRVVSDGGDELKQRLPLEWSYALYKTGKLDEAREAASAASSVGAKHVEAQTAYRAEDFNRTLEVYKTLLDSKTDSQTDFADFQINISAAEAQNLWTSHSRSVSNVNASSGTSGVFEIVYNSACEHIAGGHLHSAYDLLMKAKALCEGSEDLSPEDKIAEVLPIAVQALYVALQLGKFAEADALIEEIDINRIQESSNRIIAQNNILVLRPKDSNPYTTHKQFHDCARPGSSDGDRLFSYQSSVLSKNSYVIDLLVQKYDGVFKSTSKLISKEPSATTSPYINSLAALNAAAYTRGEYNNNAIKTISPLVNRHPGIVLVLVQLYVGNGDFNSAISVLEGLIKRLESSDNQSDMALRFSPGLVNVLVSLYKTQGRKTQIAKELSRAARYWQSSQGDSQSRPFSLLLAAAVSFLGSLDRSDITSAAQLFSDLHSRDDTDRITNVGYITSRAISSFSTAESEANDLTPIRDLIADVDIDALEEAGVLLQAASTSTTASSGVKRRATTTDSQERGKKRIRKVKDKEVDPNKKPDPERWLPLMDRSSYRPKGKKGKQKGADRTQGGITNEKTEEANAPSRGNNQPPGGGKKKKGKGKK